MENLITQAVLMKIYNKISLYLKTIKRQEVEIHGLLHPVQSQSWIFSCAVQSLQLTSTQSEIPLAPKSHVFLNYVLNSEQNCSFFLFRSEL
jgi:hypothetical protein